MCHHCRDPPLLLPGILLLDVSRGGPAVPHACGSLRERILAEEVLLRLWLPLSCHCGCRLDSYWLQELWDRESVSGLTQRISVCKEPHMSAHFRLHSGSWSFFVRLEKLLHFLRHLKRPMGSTLWFGGVATLKRFCVKTLLWPLVWKCSLKRKRSLSKKSLSHSLMTAPQLKLSM